MPAAAFLTVDQLARLAGLTDRHLRRLAAEGCFPKAARGRYPLVPTIHGLLRYYRQREEECVLQEVYESFAACAAATGIPVRTLQRARQQGCPVLRGKRVRLPPFLRWWYRSGEGVDYDRERAQHVVLQNAKLKVALRRLKRELVPAGEVRGLGAELGAAIRKVVTRMHRVAPSLEGRQADVIEDRLKEQEEEVLAQVRILDDRLAAWREMAGK